jgi:hypothetical protein
LPRLESSPENTIMSTDGTLIVAIWHLRETFKHKIEARPRK